MRNNNTAILSSKGEYSSFQFQDLIIRFLTGINLDHYTKVIEWDHGYLVVMCKTKSDPDIEEEDYIDLLPILKNLYIDPDTFLNPIEKVEVHYD
ncbi:MAG: hypothetical protein IJI14_07140 [Anaerolineaceae bacterium]|nr:hypothetical protein [Anaerolineaceae bacterium]